jgi:hypothetical protein
VCLSSLFLEILIDIILSTIIFSLFLYKNIHWFSLSSVSFQCFPQTNMLYANINVFMSGPLFYPLTFIAISFIIALNMTAWEYTSLLSPLLFFNYSGHPNFNLTQFVLYCMSDSLFLPDVIVFLNFLSLPRFLLSLEHRITFQNLRDNYILATFPVFLN